MVPSPSWLINIAPNVIERPISFGSSTAKETSVIRKIDGQYRVHYSLAGLIEPTREVAKLYVVSSDAETRKLGFSRLSGVEYTDLGWLTSREIGLTSLSEDEQHSQRLAEVQRLGLLSSKGILLENREGWVGTTVRVK